MQLQQIEPILRPVLRRAARGLAILLAIVYLTLLGLIMAERGKAGLPAGLPDVSLEAARRTLDYLVNHPTFYHWHRQDLSTYALVLSLFGRSAALLLVALGLAALVGIPLGAMAALLRPARAAPVVLLLSVLGVSVPSFLLAMLLWVVNIRAYHWLGFDSAPLPPTGFGWDAHMVMPVIVLAARPLAQIVQVTYVSLSDVLGEDYIRTAQAKGLAWRTVVSRHALRNILISILTTLSASMRFSLASLPVVEAFFVWPGVGLTLLQAIEAGLTPLVVDLVVSLGFLFLLINALLEVTYQVVDPRLRQEPLPQGQREPKIGWEDVWEEVLAQVAAFTAWIRDLRDKVLRRLSPSGGASQATDRRLSTPDLGPTVASDSTPTRRHSSLWLLRRTLGNWPLLAGLLLVSAFVGLALWGEAWAPASPYETHGVMMIEQKIASPPFAPSTVFPWGSDVVGRDIQALVLAGARQTLALALLGMLARTAVGAALGVVAGWQRGGWVDRLVSAAVAVWAAFPVTLFAMILILALGIQQGSSVFIIALCVVGWGEIAQFVRGQVISLRPQLYIEAARAVGAHTGRILTRHILPHLWSPLLVLAMLEMGSILMLLAELGFLNIFLGGGFRVEMGETGRMASAVYYFSDVPEWGALLANIRNWWRSCPWMAWYPGLAFFLAILAFNLWGEGLRRFMEDSRVNLGRLVNRYTLIIGILVVIGAGWLARKSAAMAVYSTQTQQFNVQRAMQHIQELTSPRLQGREAGLPGEHLAAEYIATQMEEIGLFPAGEKETYLAPIVLTYQHLIGLPRLAVLDGQGQVSEALIYRQDFVEYTLFGSLSGHNEGNVVGLAAGPDPDSTANANPYDTGALDLAGKVVIARESDFERISGLTRKANGVLLIPSAEAGSESGDTSAGDGPFPRKYLFSQRSYSGYFERARPTPAMVITPQAAERLLATAGSSLAQLDAMAGNLSAGQLALTAAGARLDMDIPVAPENLDERHFYVVGFIPGSGALMGEDQGQGLDNKVVIVSAYYDGLGVGPDGRLYPGANDNASGVAAMLEIARALKASSLQPRKTIVFVAWGGGERGEGFSVTNAMGAKRGFNQLTVEAVIELSGLAAGGGAGLALGPGTSFSLVQLFQDAAGRVGVPVTTRGRGPHFNLTRSSGYGGRSALSAFVSWDGSDQSAHTVRDTFEAIDPDKLRLAGLTTFLAVSSLGQAEAQASPQQPLTTAGDYVQGARMFDETQALAHIQHLADDALEGRRSGTPGGQAAGDYIAARLAEYGLQPAGTDGSYFQPFTTPYTTNISSPALSVASSSGIITYTYHTDYLPFIGGGGYLGSGQGHGQVVWLNDCAASDFDRKDLAGKIALCESPTLINKQSVERALDSQVGGILAIGDRHGPFVHPSYRRGDLVDLPIFYITDAIAQDVLQGSGYSLNQLNTTFTAVPLSTTVSMAADIQPRPIEARNVLGLLPGSDPEHKDEIVVLGAHYDHMGRDPDGTIYNGANDNASGVAVMLEVARLWQAQGFRPARSVLFAAWDDEEQGLLGSYYYVKNPPFPLDRTVAMLNLDMVGRGEELFLDGRGLMAVQLEASARVYSSTIGYQSQQMGGSDHLPFWEMGVQAGGLSWAFDDHSYHRPEDDVQNIWPGSLRAIGVLTAHSLAAWSGGGPSASLPGGPQRSLRDLILPTPTCAPPWPVGAMTCDHGQWER